MNSVYGKYFTKMAAIWGGCFVLFLIINMLVLAPQKNTKKALEQKLQEKKRIHNLAMEMAKKENKIKLNEELEDLREQLDAVVIDFESATNLTFEISRIANEKEVSSFSIDSKRGADRKDKNSKNKYISESNYDVSFLAKDFNQFATLLNTLERHKPTIFVDMFTIKRSGPGGGDDSKHRVKMDLTVLIKEKKLGTVAKL
jgi:hypothetical protein